MNELQTKYKALIIMLSLISVAPIFLAVSNEAQLKTFLEVTYVVQAAADHYNIEMDACIKCQENGWIFAAILIVSLVLVILVSYVAALIPLAMILKLFAGWPFSFTIKTLLLGKFPEEWKTTNT